MTSTLEEIQVGYDIGDEFFRLWLDEKMHYSCGVFDAEHPSLELAQRNKCRILADFEAQSARWFPCQYRRNASGFETGP